jgi:hypothetical protein
MSRSAWDVARARQTLIAVLAVIAAFAMGYVVDRGTVLSWPAAAPPRKVPR